MTTIDVVVLLLLAFGVVAWGVWSFRRLDPVLSDPEHPGHEDAKAAVEQMHREAERDRLRFP